MKLIKNFFAIHSQLFIILLFFVVMTFPLPYYIISPGGITDAAEEILVAEKPIKEGFIYKTYVTSRTTQLPTLVVAYLMPNWEIRKIEELPTCNYETQRQIDRKMLELGNDIATIVAFQTAQKPIEIETINTIVLGILKNAKTDLKSGDIILDYSVDEILAIRDKTAVGEQIIFRVERDDQIIETITEVSFEEDNKFLGIIFTDSYQFSTDPLVEFKPRQQASGSSGGFMVALAIFDAITEYESNYQTIAGSGAINIEGKLLSISGLKYKMLGAEKANIELFLVAKANYEMALAIKEEHNLTMKVKGFEYFLEAVEYLYDY